MPIRVATDDDSEALAELAETARLRRTLRPAPGLTPDLPRALAIRRRLASVELPVIVAEDDSGTITVAAWSRPAAIGDTPCWVLDEVWSTAGQWGGQAVAVVAAAAGRARSAGSPAVALPLANTEPEAVAALQHAGLVPVETDDGTVLTNLR